MIIFVTMEYLFSLNWSKHDEKINRRINCLSAVITTKHQTDEMITKLTNINIIIKKIQ